MEISADHFEGLHLTTIRDTGRIRIRNRASEACRVTVATVTPRSGNPLPLHRVEREMSTLKKTYPPLISDFTSPLLETDAAWSFQLQWRHEGARAASQTTLLKITTSLGTVRWIPVHATDSTQS